MAFHATAAVAATLLGFDGSAETVIFPVALYATSANPEQPSHFLGAVSIFSGCDNTLP